VHERLGRYLWTSGRDREAAEVYARAVELMPAEPPTAELARVLASQAQVLMLNGRPRESADFAREAITIARAVGDRSVEANALNTLGVDLAGLGARKEGIELVRNSLAIHEELADDDQLHRDYTNLSDLLDQSGRVEEGIELALHGAHQAREKGMGRGFASFLLAEAANRCTRLGRLAEADDLTSRSLDFGPGGVSAFLAHSERARVLLMLGRSGEARPHTVEAKRLMRHAIGPMWIGPMYARLVELAEIDGSIDQVRRVVAEAREQMSGAEEYAFYARELYLAALRAEAGEAQRARAARDEQAERAARDSGAEMARGMRAAAAAAGAEGSPPPQVLADLELVAAELARLEGHERLELWRGAGDSNERIGNRLALGYARMREAEAAVESGSERSHSATCLREAHEIALDCGAEPLREACAGLARRARLDLTGESEPAPAGEDPFGLTPREREVLELVAAGRTNRQIGEVLFMSEKTASVHVSRILAKLEVSTRGEAGAVAHRLGLDGA
jgi:DNA-binding CsgD family transcriptional regulator/tetratricopeptide (TPR) repeat protein